MGPVLIRYRPKHEGAGPRAHPESQVTPEGTPAAEEAAKVWSRMESASGSQGKRGPDTHTHTRLSSELSGWVSV